MKIIFLVPYPDNVAPSQRFRFEQYLPILKKEGFTYEVHPFLDQHTWNILYKEGHLVIKILGLLKGYLRRLKALAAIRKGKWIFIHREVTPLGPPIFEWIISKIFRKRIIFDFDDAIWLPNTSSENKAAKSFKGHQKTASICKWSYKISVGNQFLAKYALSYNLNVVVNPTTIDTENYHNRLKDQYSDEPVIGWTGTHSTLKYLYPIIPVLQRLEAVYHFMFIVIADKDPRISLKSYRFIKWSQNTEIDDLLKFNIGVMPLTDDPWSRGKCGFKALQYLALGIPAVASPVGVNQSIINHGSNGYLCTTEEDWYDKLKILLKEPDLRYLMGRNGRSKVEKEFSVNSNKENFLSLFTKTNP